MIELFRAAVSDIIKDDGFQIQTKPARNALTSAEKILEWIDSNKDEAKAVASHLIGNIQRCFSKKSKNPRTARDINYFQLCSSDAPLLNMMHVQFLTSISQTMHNRASTFLLE